MFYVKGVLDAWAFIDGMATYATKEELSAELSLAEGLNHKIVLCLHTRGWEVGQILAVVQKYVTDKPNEWHRQMPDIMFRALSDACKKE